MSRCHHRGAVVLCDNSCVNGDKKLQMEYGGGWEIVEMESYPPESRGGVETLEAQKRESNSCRKTVSA